MFDGLSLIYALDRDIPLVSIAQQLVDAGFIVFMLHQKHLYRPQIQPRVSGNLHSMPPRKNS